MQTAAGAQAETRAAGNLFPPEGSRVRFSVIVATLNEERSLPLCLESLSRVGRRDFEVLVMDGGSRDATGEVARRYGARFVVVPKKRPHDVAGARNEGIRRSRGEYIFFLDADMLVDPGCFDAVEPELRRGAIGVSLRVLPHRGSSLERAMYEFNAALCRLSAATRVYQLSYFSCHCYRKDCIERVGGFREDLLSCEDMDLSIRLSNLGRFVFSSRSTLWASPRRVRQWSGAGYVAKYLKFLVQYYALSGVSDYYDDMPG